MIYEEVKRSRIKALLSSLVFSVILMIFPVISGVIVTINRMDTLRGYYLQGIFMMLSIAVPVIFMWITKIKPSHIGFAGLKKGSIKKVLCFVPAIAAKTGFLFFEIIPDVRAIMALAFFTIAIGISEELYFRGIILRRLRSCFTIKQTVILSSVFFAAVHAAQAFSGAGFVMVALTIINAFIFGIVASEIVLITKSILPVIVWHALFDFINWISLVNGTPEITLIIIQSIITVLYAYYLWSKLPDEQVCPC